MGIIFIVSLEVRSYEDNSYWTPNMKFLLLLLVLLATVLASSPPVMSKKCKKTVKKYNKCLKDGFESSLGCDSGDGTVKGKALKKCKSAEKKAKKCGHTCVPPPPPPPPECQDSNGASYRGKVAVTVSGRKCQSWNSQSPNEHSRTPANYPNSGLVDNYCRNPDGEVGAWCYNDEGKDPRWELCDIPKC